LTGRVYTPSALTRLFVSADQVITAAGALTLAHGLGVAPRLCTFGLVCVTAEAGYAVNDVIEFDVPGAAAAAPSFSYWLDSTNINIRFNTSVSTFDLNHKTTGAASNLTNANWRLRVRAFA
jgi:hypothetical protein